MGKATASVWINRYFWLALVFAVMLTFALGVMEELLGIIAALVSMFLIVLLSLPGLTWGKALGYTSLFAVLLLIGITRCVQRGCPPPSSATKQNMYAIQLAVERYATDFDGYYPLNMEAVKATGYLPEFPRNYYIYESAWENRYERDQQQMVNLGEMNVVEQQHPLFASGNFVYAPKLAVVDGELRATSYALYGIGGESCWLGFARKENPAFVIIELGEGLNKKAASRNAPY